MPTRFEYLVAVESAGAALRQPVPEGFEQQDEATAEAYLVWLLSEAEKARAPFFEKMTSAIRKFNNATWPRQLPQPTTKKRGCRRERRCVTRHLGAKQCVRHLYYFTSAPDPTHTLS